MKVNKVKLGQYCREWREKNNYSLQSMAIKSNTIYGMTIDNPSDFLLEGSEDE